MNILVAYQRQAAWLFRGTHMGTKNRGVGFCPGTFTKAQIAGGPAGSPAVTEVTVTGLKVSCRGVLRAQVI
jgi:hypothetical protein